MEKMKLKELINVRTGKLDANASSENGKYPFFTCSKETLKIDTYSYDCECVLLAGNGDLNVKYYNGKFDAYQRTYILECKNEIISTKYLYYFMKKYLKILRNQSIGGVIKYIKLANITEAIIPIYNKEEQEEIVNNLSKVEQILNIKNKQIEELQKFIKSQFVEMFDLEKYKIEELGKICDVRDGTHDSPKYIEKSDYKLITSKNINKEGIDFSDVKYISKKDYDKINIRSNVSYGDILMPMIGTIGNPTIVTVQKEKIDFAIKNLALIKFLNKTLVINKYIKNLINSEWFENKILKNRRGGTQKFISLKDIRKMKIPVPPITLQNQFSEIIKQIDKQKFEIEKSLKETQELYESLMEKYFG